MLTGYDIARLAEQVARRIIEARGDNLAFSVQEAARVSGLGRTKLYESIRDGRLVARKFGSRTIVLRTDLKQFLEDLPVVAVREEYR